MAFTVSPSVIVREVDASATVPAIATSPGAIAGVFRWGPVNEPILITSEDNLVTRFGKPSDSNYETFFTAADFLAYANPLYVVRADQGAKADSWNYVLDGNNDIIVESSTFGTFESKYKGEIGNSLEVAYARGDDFKNVVIGTGGTAATIPANQVVYSSNTAPAQEITFNSTSFAFQMGPANRLNTDSDVAFNPNDKVVIGTDAAGYQELGIVSFTETLLDPDGDALGDQSNAAAASAFSYNMTFDSRYTISETRAQALKIERKWKYANLFGKAAEDNNHYHIAVIDGDGNISGSAGTVLELYENISKTSGAQLSDGTDNYYETVIENQSMWVAVSNTAHFAATTTAYENLAGGNDGVAESAATLGSLGAAYDKLKNSNEINISAVMQGKADNAGNIANYIVSNVADYRKDCVAYLSPSYEASITPSTTSEKMSKIIEYREKLQSSSYWFMDSGYKYRYDKYNDKYRWVPMNGDTAGLAARVESWESPAGFRKGVIKNVVKLGFNPDKAQRDELYSADINPIISQVGQGIILFGDKTGLGSVSAFDRLNVRRLFIAVEKAIATASQSFLFELNDEFTQTQFRNAIEPFLRDIQGRRGIVDFRIVSDGTINTPTVIDANKFRANIFIKPARSINTIELTFVATRSGVEFDEIVGQLT